MTKQWNRLTEIISGQSEEAPENSQKFVEVRKLRSKFISCWKVYRKSHYPINTLLKAKDFASNHALWKQIEKFCGIGTRTAIHIFAYLATNNDTYLVLDTELVFHTERQLLESQVREACLNVCQNVQNALTNEQKGNFTEARSDYRKALGVVKDLDIHAKLRETIVKDIMLYLENLENQWESWQKMFPSSPPDSLFRTFCSNDIPSINQIANYKEFAKLKKQILVEKKDLEGVLDDWENLTKLVKSISYSTYFAEVHIKYKHVLEIVEENARRPFQPWYIPDEERSIVCDERLAIDWLKKANEITNGRAWNDRPNALIYQYFVQNRKKYSTLKKMKKSVFGLSASPRMSKSEKLRYVDDALSFDDVTTTVSASHSTTTKVASHRRLPIFKNAEDNQRGL